MDVKEIEILGADIGTHWYYRSKTMAMESMLEGLSPRKIVDIGAGSGHFSRHILATTDAVEAWCVDTGYETDMDDPAVEGLHYRRGIGAVDADLVLLMDVMEHVDDDVALLMEYVAKVPSGSHFLISVPAFAWLWSGHDEFLEHKRRYTLAQLEDVIASAGLSVKRGAYYFAAVFPIAAAFRMAGRFRKSVGPATSQLKKHHPLINTTLAAMCAIELPLFRMNRLGGLTAFCLAEKR